MLTCLLKSLLNPQPSYAEAGHTDVLSLHKVATYQDVLENVSNDTMSLRMDKLEKMFTLSFLLLFRNEAYLKSSTSSADSAIMPVMAKVAPLP